MKLIFDFSVPKEFVFPVLQEGDGLFVEKFHVEHVKIYRVRV